MLVLVFKHVQEVFKYWKVFKYWLVTQKKQPSCIKHFCSYDT